MNRFLFELGLEEIPPTMIASALEQMRQSFHRFLDDSQVRCGSLRSYSSPRRLALLVEDIPDRQPDRQELVLGPPRSVAYDAQDRPTAAVQGFARKAGVGVADLEIVETERGAYLAYQKEIPGRPVPEILQEILPHIVTSISWPKNMYWRETRFRFVRPLRWCVALWNQEIIPFDFEGIRSGPITRGHRFLGRQEIKLSKADEYVKQLRDNFVIVDTDERREAILKGIEQETPPGLRVLPDTELVELLLYLTEYPGIIRGAFSEDFLKLPQEVLVTVMRHHQKYFSVLNGEGNIQSYFLAVLNQTGDPDGRIRRGHEKVLRARLEDASFFWEVDRKKPLKERLPELAQISFQEKLGTYRDKTERIRRLCSRLDKDPGLDQAATLCKVDLTTEMVREFTELQGVMGGLYAREEGYPEEVWRAIYEHYKPVSLEDASPSIRQGAVLSVADKLDTIVGCFGINIIPTGSSDPFALRRQGQGLVKVLFDHSLDFPLRRLVKLAQDNFTPEGPREEVQAQVLDFLLRRVRYIFQEKGIGYDVINAVFAVEAGSVDDAYRRAEALNRIRGQEDFEALAAAYKRIKNILEDRAIELTEVSERDLVEPEEQKLYQAYRKLRPEIEDQVKSGNYLVVLKRLAGLRNLVDRFFDKVLVMAGDDRLRNNRLRLLYDISQLFLQVADISEIVQEGIAKN